MVQSIKFKVQSLFLGFCLLTISIYSQDSTQFKIYYYPSGTKSSEGYLVNGKPDKYWITYFENGKIRTEGNRKNFELDSAWKFYNEKGLLETTIEYKQGKKNGWKITYYDSIVVLKEHFINDEKEGWSYSYYPSGKLKNEMWFEKGKQSGFTYGYSDKSDTLITEISVFKNGILQKKEEINKFNTQNKKQGKWKWFYDDKTIKAEVTYKNDLFNGYYKTYDYTGKLKEIIKYENGVKVEDAPELAQVEVKKEYYPDMKVKSSGSYVNGKKEGVHKLFDEEGKIIATKVYKADVEIGSGIIGNSGKREGEWKEFYENGQLKVKGQFKNDVKTGKWIFYYNNGQIEQTGEYNNKGLPTGEWKWYYYSGKLLREETFENGLEEGMLSEYSETGKIITKGLYSLGLKEGEWVYEMGVYKEIGYYKNDLKEGLWKHIYTDNGKLRYEGSFQMDNAVGKHKFFYPSGMLKCEGPYVGGSKNGDWSYYNEAGEIEKIITFRNDEEYKINGLKVISEEKKNDGEKQ